jgi:hypothetical protein
LRHADRSVIAVLAKESKQATAEMRRPASRFLSAGAISLVKIKQN